MPLAPLRRATDSIPGVLTLTLTPLPPTSLSPSQRQRAGDTAALASRAHVLQRRATDLSPFAVARTSTFRRRSGDRATPGAASSFSPLTTASLTAQSTTAPLDTAPLGTPPLATAPSTNAPFTSAPSPHDTPAAALAATAAQQPALKLFVRGFNDIEKRLLDGMVRLSQRRLPRLALVSEHEALAADLLMIDGADERAVAWIESRPGLATKPTIWIDSRVLRAEHTMSRRPVNWPLLPMMIARALERPTAGADAAPLQAAPAARAAQAPQAGTAPQRVLVVDDSLAVRNHLRSLLEARGVEVSEADCVAAALGSLRSGRFACVLMDVLMPDMDGYEGCKRIKALRASLGTPPVVMLTSKSSPFDRIRGKMAGCDAYLTKPVAPALLYGALERYLGATAAPLPVLAPRSASA